VYKISRSLQNVQFCSSSSLPAPASAACTADRCEHAQAGAEIGQNWMLCKGLISNIWLLLFFLVVVLLVPGCSSRHVSHDHHYAPIKGKTLARMGYTIQAGAFSKVENAARLTDYLNRQNLDAYYFAYRKGLYKVRFGNFQSKEYAYKEAEILKAMGTIDSFYIVSPSEYSAAKERKYGKEYLRAELVKTAKTFIGVPYRWGGSSASRGFDCSGLTMAVYKLNGLNLPRTSIRQYRMGAYIDRNNLSGGDLVFFNTSGNGKVSHVGMYLGDGKFIHAPRRGKTVRISSLSSKYYRKRYLGARSYL